MRPCLPALVVTALCAALLLSAQGARAQVLPWAVGQTRGGIPVVAVGAPGAPWSVVQLHVRLDGGELTPAERRSLEAALGAFADGAMAGRAQPASSDATQAGGKTTRRIGADHAVVSEGAPADKLELLLKLVDERLRGRARLLPATRRVDEEPTADPPMDPRAVALAMPGHPAALPSSGGAADAAAIRATLDRVLRRDRIALAVVGPQAPGDLLGLVLRTVAAPLPPAPAGSALAPPALAPGTLLAERAAPGAPTSTVWLVGAGRGAPGASPEQRAARSVLARLVGGHVESTESAFAIALTVDAGRASALPRAEAKRLQQLADVARTPPAAELVAALRTQERAERLQRLTSPAAIADALGRALLAGDAGLVDKELAALEGVTPEAVAREAGAAASGPRVVARSLGAK